MTKEGIAVKILNMMLAVWNHRNTIVELENEIKGLDIECENKINNIRLERAQKEIELCRKRNAAIGESREMVEEINKVIKEAESMGVVIAYEFEQKGAFAYAKQQSEG